MGKINSSKCLGVLFRWVASTSSVLPGSASVCSAPLCLVNLFKVPRNLLVWWIWKYGSMELHFFLFNWSCVYSLSTEMYFNVTLLLGNIFVLDILLCYCSHLSCSGYWAYQCKLPFVSLITWENQFVSISSIWSEVGCTNLRILRVLLAWQCFSLFQYSDDSSVCILLEKLLSLQIISKYIFSSWGWLMFSNNNSGR